MPAAHYQSIIDQYLHYLVLEDLADQDRICVIYIGQSLFLIMSCTWINNEVSSVSSGINSAVSICKITLSAYCESVIILRGSLKSLSTIRMAYNSAFWTES